MKKYVYFFILTILLLEKSLAISLNSFEKSNTKSNGNSIGIAVGQFYDGRGFQPWLAVSKNNGMEWSYPVEIYSSTTLPKYPFSGGGLFGASCSDKTCIASGVYSYEKTRPVIAISQDNGVSWSYPEEVYASFPSFLYSGFFKAASCSEKTCIASGVSDKYDESTGYYPKRPLIAISQDNGHAWSYPESIYTSALPTNFVHGSFSAATCSNKLCIAAGDYFDSNKFDYRKRPLLAVTQDGGITWTYPSAIYSKESLPSTFWNLGQFSAASCSGNVCIASGEYVDDPVITKHSRPLLVMSQDGGATWSYPEAIYKSALPPSFLEGTLITASCSKKICIASGYYHTKENYPFARPLLAMSQDGGHTWSYPEAIYSDSSLPKQFSYGSLEGGASCSGNVCIATGYYYTQGKLRPLLAFTKDGGVNWSYPNAIYSLTTLPQGFQEGEFKSASCQGNFCIASGHFYEKDIQQPLLVMSNNGGDTWSYPSSIYSAANLPPLFKHGHLDGASALSGYAVKDTDINIRSMLNRGNSVKKYETN